MDCARCEGLGYIELVRCPAFYQEDWMHEFFEAYKHLDVGILPDAGGYQDQTADFVNITRAIGDQVSECEREDKRNRERMAKAAKGGKAK